MSKQYLALGVLSASSLSLEIILTRLLSTLFFPPYVFVVISVALLGIGIGAAVSVLLPVLRQTRWIPYYASAAGMTTLIIAVIAVLSSSSIVLLGLITLPFACVGLVLTALFSTETDQMSQLYMADLIGAGIGVILATLILNAVGGIQGVIVAAIGFFLSGMIFCSLLPTMGIVAAGILFVMANSWLRVDMSDLGANKSIDSVLNNGGSIIDTAWDAFARTDVIDPGEGRPLQIYVDGGAASIMPTADRLTDLRQDIGFFPFATDQPEKVFIIGPGGGLDVWFGLQSNAKEILGVEVNPASVAFVESYTDIYTQPQVEIIVDEGRSVLRRSDTQYNLIFLSQVVTLAAERSGYALTENTVYTVEAFEEYLSHLAPDGQIALKLYDEITLTRALSTALTALKNQQNLTDAGAMKHMIVLLDAQAASPTPLLMIRNTPYTEDDSLVFGAIARDVGFAPLTLPEVLVQPPLDAVAQGIRSFDNIIAESEQDISAPTDDRPYFFQFERTLPDTLQSLLTGMGIAAGITLVVVLFMLRNAQSMAERSLPLYFALLGIGFIIIEVVVIQKTRLFLGHPTFAVSLILFTFLVGGGLGSGLSRFIPQLRLWSPLIVAALFIVWNGLWPLLSDSFFANSLLIRGLFTILLVLPLALMMGIPFPTGLRLASLYGTRQIALAWGVNGVMTVIGSVIAVVVSMLAGFNTVALMGAGAYLLAGVISQWSAKQG